MRLVLSSLFLCPLIWSAGCAGPKERAAPPVPEAAPVPGAAPVTATEIFDRVIDVIQQDFVFPERVDDAWRASVARKRTTITDATEDAELVAALDGLARQLGASHTRVLGADQPLTDALRCIFSGDLDAFPRATIGIETTETRGTRVVERVLEGSGAERAGIQVGDVLIPSGRSLLPTGKERASLSIVRDGVPATVEVPVAVLGVGREHFGALRASERIIERDDVSIATAHLWSGTHPAFETELARFIRSVSGTADAFVLDLRGGFGGAHPGYLDPFFPTKRSDGSISPAIFTGPLVAVIDRGTRSGKEWITWLLRSSGRGRLVGTTTAGAFLAGRFTEVVPERIWLFLAVAKGPEGIDLEGTGVAPDIEVRRDLRNPAIDLPFEAALAEAARLVRKARVRGDRVREAREE